MGFKGRNYVLFVERCLGISFIFIFIFTTETVQGEKEEKIKRSPSSTNHRLEECKQNLLRHLHIRNYWSEWPWKTARAAALPGCKVWCQPAGEALCVAHWRRLCRGAPGGRYCPQRRLHTKPEEECQCLGYGSYQGLIYSGHSIYCVSFYGFPNNVPFSSQNVTSRNVTNIW